MGVGPDGVAAFLTHQGVDLVHPDAVGAVAVEQVGLLASRREGRSILYSAVYPTLSGLIAFLMRDCCQGHPEVCAPAVAALSCACEPTGDTHA